MISQAIVAEKQTTVSDGEGQKRLSIYDVHTKSKKNAILITLSLVGFLCTYDTFAYVTAVPAMVQDFHASETLGVISISIYVFTLSISSLVWGPLLDYYGRRSITIVILGAFMLSIVGGYFATNVTVFLFFRALQGLLVSITIVVGQATIADIYQPKERGSAYGIFYAFYFSPVLFAPVISGFLSEHFGWRSTFISVIIISLVVWISYVSIVPETQQYRVLRTYETEQNTRFLESEQIPPPALTNPCSPLSYLADRTILPYALVLLSSATAVSCGTLMLSSELAKPPYSYSEDIIGVLYAPYGIAILLGSVIGGKLSDLVTNESFRLSKATEGRIVPGLILSLLTPIGLIIYGWTIQCRVRISIPLLSQIFYAFGLGAFRPGVISYYTIRYQEHAASINAASYFLQQCGSSVVLSFSRPTIQMIGNGGSVYYL